MAVELDNENRNSSRSSSSSNNYNYLLLLLLSSAGLRLFFLKFKARCINSLYVKIQMLTYICSNIYPNVSSILSKRRKNILRIKILVLFA